MNRYLIVLAAALGAASLARAEYIVIVANLSGNDLSSGGASGGPPMMGGGPPMMGGGPPMRGGGPPMMGGGPPMGGGFPPSMGPPPGMTGGAIGFPGGGATGYMGGMPGPGGGPTNPDAIDETPTLIVAVLEVKRATTPGAAKLWEAGQPVYFTHRLAPSGKGIVRLQKKTGQYEAALLSQGSGRALATVADRFKALQAETFKDKDKATAEGVLALARKALDFGLVDDFAKTMEKLAELDKTSPKVAAFKKIQEALDKPAGKPDLEAWKKLLPEYKAAQPEKSRFALLHAGASDTAPEVTRAVARLDRSLKAYYYWWAFNGVALPVPAARIVSVLTPEGPDFGKIKGIVSAGPVVADAFHAPREGLSVFSSKRGDEQYSHLTEASKDLWTGGFHKIRILSGKTGEGGPRGPPPAPPDPPRTIALLLRALEEEWDRAAVTHKTARELVYASGLLPRRVHAPEWVQFGMGSMFESPLQSPWSGIGTPNSYWLPRFKDYDKAGKYGDTDPKKAETKRKAQLATLVRIVTDEEFRRTGGKDARANLRHARAAAWSLTYYLAQVNLAGLQAYFKELSRQPRDLDLDKDVLLACFAKAMGCWDKEAGKPNLALLETLADRWFTHARAQTMEAEAIHTQIRSFYAKIGKPVTPPAGGGTTPGSGGVVPPGGR